MIQSDVNDDNIYSELYVYVDYNGAVRWTQNGLKELELHQPLGGKFRDGR
jgi:hypothetical protein